MAASIMPAKPALRHTKRYTFIEDAFKNIEYAFIILAEFHGS
jgi:hypothetical protein